MPLLDHFHAPLKSLRHWESFHSGWANSIAAELNQVLPPRYFAEPHPRFGIEVDVAAFDSGQQKDNQILREVATLPYTTVLNGNDDQHSHTNGKAWQPKPPPYSVPFEVTTQSITMLIYSADAGPVLVGAIELVRPANKV